MTRSKALDPKPVSMPAESMRALGKTLAAHASRSVAPVTEHPRDSTWPKPMTRATATKRLLDRLRAAPPIPKPLTQAEAAERLFERLRWSFWFEELVAAMADSPLLQRLSHVSFDDGDMGTKGANILVSQASRFSYLERLTLVQNLIKKTSETKINKAFPVGKVYVGSQRSSAEEVSYRDAIYQEKF